MNVENFAELNFYEVLDIRRDANISEIKLSYKKLIHRYHPDISKETSDTEKFKIVSKAYKILVDPVKRLEYDKSLTLLAEKPKVNLLNINKKKIEIISNKPKFVIKEIFNRKKIDAFFDNIKKVRSDIRRKRFVEREFYRIQVTSGNENGDGYFDSLSDIELIARLKNSTNHFVRMNAAKIIGKRRDHFFTFELVKALSDSSPLVRKEAVRSLGSYKDFRCINFLVNAIYDYDADVRTELSIAMRYYNDMRTVSALLKLLSDKNENVVKEAVLSLGVIGDSDIIGEIRKLLYHNSFQVKRAAYEVLKILRNS